VQEAESEPDNNNGDAEKRNKLDGGKKRKRKKIKHTDCKGKDGCEIDC